jgi:hypothetical protein
VDQVGDEQQRQERRPTARSARRSSLRPSQEQGKSRSQSPDVVEHDVAHARRRERLRDVAALLGGGLGEAAAQLRAARVDAELASRSRVDEPQLAAFGSSCSRGSRISTAITSCRPASWSSGRASRGSAEVGDETTSERCRASASVRRIASPSERRADPVLVGRLASRAARRAARSGRVAPGARARARLASPNVRRRAGCRAASPRARSRSRLLRDVGLAPVGGAERIDGDVSSDEPGDEHALGVLHADVRLAGPRGDVPVDLAHVVARHVRPDLRELAAVAEEGER